MNATVRSLVLLSSLLASGAAYATTADLVLEDGHIVTLESSQPTVQALAVKGGRILALGNDADMGPYIGPATQIVDLKGMTAVPGFIEGHGHFMELGRTLTELDLTKAKDWDGIVALVAAAVKQAKPGQWILGWGWHQEKWDHAPQPNVEGLPLHASLDAVSPANPVMLAHASGHGVFVNAFAMKLAGISKATPDPQGGQIVRDASGEPIGFLRDNAMDPARDAYALYMEGCPRAAPGRFLPRLPSAPRASRPRAAGAPASWRPGLVR